MVTSHIFHPKRNDMFIFLSFFHPQQPGLSNGHGLFLWLLRFRSCGGSSGLAHIQQVPSDLSWKITTWMMLHMLPLLNLSKSIKIYQINDSSQIHLIEKFHESPVNPIKTYSNPIKIPYSWSTSTGQSPSPALQARLPREPRDPSDPGPSPRGEICLSATNEEIHQSEAYLTYWSYWWYLYI